MKKFLLTICVALAALAVPALAQDVESSYKFDGALCTEMDAIPKFQALFEKYRTEPGAIMVAAAEHNLPCTIGTTVTKQKEGRYIMSFQSKEDTKFDILAWPWGESTVFSMRLSTENNRAVYKP
ncbi:MAG: hypothetical protein G01um101456_617 [Parcubacteria group bacterium Gr01-1014_56]|nr:MAG: hypothetical protein G01um101456_617 [Parcubacteria group bacterium Gr01-1014_56]